MQHEQKVEGINDMMIATQEMEGMPNIRNYKGNYEDRKNDREHRSSRILELAKKFKRERGKINRIL